MSQVKVYGPWVGLEPLNQQLLTLFTSMPTIKMSVPHNLGEDAAKQRITTLVSDAKKQMGANVTDIEETWSGNTNSFKFRVMGFSISGRLEVRAKEVHGEVDLPFAALPFKSKIEGELASRAKQLLA